MNIQTNSDFSNWALGFSGCDGGDAGTKSERATWVCGIEWGGGHKADTAALTAMFADDVSNPPDGYDTWMDNLAYIFNWQAMKLLGCVNGGQVSGYKKFSEEIKPFTKGNKGYFKLNLYPLGFRDTSHSRWVSEFSNVTGLSEKMKYHQWIQANRFPVMRAWAKKYSPKLIICTGVTYQLDFIAAFGEEGMNLTTELIDERQLIYGFNADKTLIAIIPFMVNRNGLTKNVSIQKFGDRLKELLANTA